MFLLLLLFLSLVGLSAYIVSLKQAIKEIPQLIPLSSISSDYDSDSFGSPKISVIVPAYNEADNIQDCVTSILKSANFLAENIEVWVVDDRSTDKTWIILQALQRSLKDPRLKLISGLPQPEGQKWTGKNWACAQAIKCAEGEFLLFIDADVRLKSGAIESALQVALSEQADLLNCIPAWTCDSLTEWLVQPLMLINLLISLNSKIAKDPKTETAFAAGPFMLFRRSAYEKVGGHEAVADQVAEDVALARLIKHNGLKIEYRLGANIATLRMYRSWGALWEGWTKVLYVGAQRNLLIMLYLAIVMLILYTVPWLGLLIILGKSLTVGLQTIDLLTIGINLIAVFFQYRLRKLATNASNSPPKYWWLQGLGGILVAVIALDSVIKTESGWGWTWRGRALK